MRVVAALHRYVPVQNAGAETMAHAMLRALARRGHDVDVVLSMQAGDPYTVDGVRVHPARSKRDLFAWLPKADVLVSHLMNSPRAAFLGKWNNIPVALIHHNTFRVTKDLPLTPQARVDLIVVNSQWMADDLAAHFRARGRPQPRTIIVRPIPDRTEYQTEPGDRVTLVNLRMLETDSDGGRMGKGAEVFWALAKRMPRTKFLGVTGGYGAQLVEDLPNVEVLPHVAAHEMRDKVYARTRVLLVPSSYESWGRVASEALCSGIPVIATPTAGLMENLGDAGIFIDASDIDGWVKALRTLAMPKPYEAARKRALTRAEWQERIRQAEEEAWCDEVERLAARKAVLA